MVNEAEAEVVRLVFERAALGWSGSAIATILNDRGHARRNGQRWTQRQVAAVLSRREMYRKGVFRYGEAAGQNVCLVVVDTAA